MLNPNTRYTCLEELRPPEGRKLDCAVATTFSLDLMTLLLAPVSMALQDYRVDKEIIDDPTALLEAIDRTSERFVVFCQQGRISIPSRHSPLYAHLEKSVIEARARNREGVFHPKAWFMRFTDENGLLPPLYRFICLTRNLTFDRSWDTALVMEGEVAENRRRGFKENLPLSRFISSLPKLAVRRLPHRIIKLVNTVTKEIGRVRFDTPEGFTGEYRFIPTGISNHRRFPEFQTGWRSLILSPFLSASVLNKFVQDGSESIIISRAESLDELSDNQFSELSTSTDFFTMDRNAETPDEDQEDESVSQMSLDDLRGLHAKLMLMENGNKVRVFTGSANATDAAFSGRNVELMVELTGPRQACGIKRLLGEESDKHTLRSMLQPYNRDQNDKPADNTFKKIEKKLEEARRRISGAGLNINIEPDQSGEFRLTLRIEKNKLDLPKGVTGRCYPVSLPEVRSKKLSELAQSDKIVFDKMTIEGLTSFAAFELTCRLKSHTLGSAFVLNLPTHGMPADRERRVLRQILKNKDRFVRYLMLILGGFTATPPGPKPAHGGKGQLPPYISPWGLPLLEEMVRAFSRDPSKIKRVERLVKDMKATGDVEDILPEGFDQVWKAFKQAHALER